MVKKVDRLPMVLEVVDGADQNTWEHPVHKPLIQVGRGPGNDLCFSDPRVSSIHGRIVFRAGQVEYQDLGSTNGSALIRHAEKQTIEPGPGIQLRQGDQLQLGDANQPSSITVVQLAQHDPIYTEATVVAQRALGQIDRLPHAQSFAQLLDLLAALRSQSDLQLVTGQVLDFCIQMIPQVARADCFMHNNKNEFDIFVSRPDDQQAQTHMSAALLGQLQSSHKVLLVEDLSTHPDPSKSMQKLNAVSILLAPVIHNEQLVGAMQLISDQGNPFCSTDLDLCSVLAQQLSALYSSAKLIQRLSEAEQRLQGQCDYLRRRLDKKPAMDEMIGNSALMQRLRKQIMAVAPSKTTVLIQGETGTGKELVARALHENSPRAQSAFAAVNCSALAAGLLESELFGHVRGAFTGAHKNRKGLFEVAHQGTLFLDEVGDMPAQLQPKLLRVLEESSVTPVGSNRPIHVDVRVICATHRDLDYEVHQARFREDLLFRINVFNLRVGPLRDRREDILLLANHFLERLSAEHGRSHPALSPEAAAALQAYDWPGNIRELRNEMERALLLSNHTGTLQATCLSNKLGGGEDLALPKNGTLKEMLEQLENMVLKNALKRYAGNRTRTARALGISRQALIGKIARLGVIED